MTESAGTALRRLMLIVAAALLGVAPVAGQTGGEARYAVTYVEVTPSGVAQAAKAFRTYHDASGRENGVVALDAFEQIGRSGHLAIVETWRDQAAFDAHQAAASLTAFKAALEGIRVSGYDQRPYKPLTAAPVRGAAGRNAVVVVSHVDIGPSSGPGKVDVPAMLSRLAETSRADAGCLRFDVVQHTARANHFTIVEAWADQQALDRHAAAAHTKQYRDEVQPLTGSPLDERVYRRLE